MLATMLFYKHIHAKYTDKYHNSQLEAIAAIYTNDWSNWIELYQCNLSWYIIILDFLGVFSRQGSI